MRGNITAAEEHKTKQQITKMFIALQCFLLQMLTFWAAIIAKKCPQDPIVALSQLTLTLTLLISKVNLTNRM